MLQDGSGKTALIDAVQLLKYALRGQPVPDKYADYVNIYAKYGNTFLSFKNEYRGRYL